MPSVRGQKKAPAPRAAEPRLKKARVHDAIHQLTLDQIDEAASYFMPWFEHLGDIGIGDNTGLNEQHGTPCEARVPPHFLRHVAVLYRLADLYAECVRRATMERQEARIRHAPYGTRTQLRRKLMAQHLKSREVLRAEALRRWKIFPLGHPSRSSLKFYRDQWSLDEEDRDPDSPHHLPDVIDRLILEALRDRTRIWILPL